MKINPLNTFEMRNPHLSKLFAQTEPPKSEYQVKREQWLQEAEAKKTALQRNASSADLQKLYETYVDEIEHVTLQIDSINHESTPEEVAALLTRKQAIELLKFAIGAELNRRGVARSPRLL